MADSAEKGGQGGSEGMNVKDLNRGGRTGLGRIREGVGLGEMEKAGGEMGCGCWCWCSVHKTLGKGI